MDRLLASAAEEEVYLKHATIGVVVVTLALLLLVEVMRHSIDVAARGHIFFQTVLDRIYREVTTLGIVELLLHLLHTLDVNLQLEEAFTKVHFMLFYTAIFNAIQSCIVRLLALQRTYKTWRVTEEIEIDHYVAIRREFDRLERQTKQVNPQHVGGNAKRSWSTDSSNDVKHSQLSYCWEYFRGASSDLTLKIRHPQLYRRRNKLLTVIRFHELRAHFIESNSLPPKFQVSSYLKRSLMSAMLDFVHISPAAWIMFTAICNMIFFFAGMILNNTESHPKVEEFLLYFFIVLMMAFVTIVTALYFKMRYIFYKMQQLKLSDPNIQTSRPTLLTSLYGGTTKSFDQLDLFWGSNPYVVIVIIQIIQFVYATGLAGVLSYYNTWNSAVIKNYEFLMVLLFSYSIFIKLTSDILPWYTLCTSMGQLVNKEILHETVAKQRLNEEIRKIVSVEEETKVEEEIARRRSEIADKNAEAASRTKGADSSRDKGPLVKSPSDVVEPMRSSDFNHVDDFPQDPIMRGIEEINNDRDSNADDVPDDMESQLNDNYDLSSGMQEESQLNHNSDLSSEMQEKQRKICQFAGLDSVEYTPSPPIEKTSDKLIALSKPIQSFQSKPILLSESTSDGIPLDVDGESDTDDVSDAMVPDETTVARRGRTKALVKGIDLMAFFQSLQYRVISFLFGPMICFWIIARVNMFNISAGLFYGQPATWVRYLDDFFWWEVSWYCLMIFEMFLVIAVCLNERNRQGSWLSCFAAVLGLVIILLCMLLLFIAEAKRCCQYDSLEAEAIHETESGHRLLASESSNSDHHDDPPLEDSSCCPEFGTRRYGGLGEIEPFTSLIILYPMRFLCASCIIAVFGNVAEKYQHKVKHKSSHHVHHEIDSEKLRDIWLTAIGVHSEVAGMFGMFSGEMLQCMLGIYYRKSIDDSKEFEISVLDDQTSGDYKGVEHQRRQKQVSSSQELFNRIQSSYVSNRDSAIKLKSSANRTDDIVTFDEFSHPTARLIRRMRRCEWILLPLLDEWMVVDAVLTSHELILFNVPDDTEDMRLAPDHAVSNLSNGGKGLYLCDVAKGRRIVSQFHVDKITGVDIEHRIAIAHKDISSDDVEVNHTANLLEYWEGGDIYSDGYQVSSMNRRWGCVDEDRLKIRFKHQTLLLRFMVDLKQMEHSSNITAHVGAKSWYSTIARLRGVANLRSPRQSFPQEGLSLPQRTLSLQRRLSLPLQKRSLLPVGTNNFVGNNSDNEDRRSSRNSRKANSRRHSALS